MVHHELLAIIPGIHGCQLASICALVHGLANWFHADVASVQRASAMDCEGLLSEQEVYLIDGLRQKSNTHTTLKFPQTQKPQNSKTHNSKLKTQNLDQQITQGLGKVAYAYANWPSIRTACLGKALGWHRKVLRNLWENL